MRAAPVSSTAKATRTLFYGSHLRQQIDVADPQYAGDAFDAIKGVILLDGAGYDLVANLASAGPRSRDTYL